MKCMHIIFATQKLQQFNMQLMYALSLHIPLHVASIFTLKIRKKILRFLWQFRQNEVHPHNDTTTYYYMKLTNKEASNKQRIK